MFVTINVTQADIDEGIAGDPTKCMVARAISRWVDFDCLISVHSRILIVRYAQNPSLNVLTAKHVLEKIHEFDNSKRKTKPTAPPKPFSFELDIPIECLKMEIPVCELVNI